MRDREREQDHGPDAPLREERNRYKEWLDLPHPNTDWALSNLAGLFDTAEAAAAKLVDATGRSFRVVGGTQVVPLPLGHQMAIVVVPIARGALYPINGRANAIHQNRAPREDECKAAAFPRWGLGKSIIANIAAAACVQWLDVKVVQPAPYYWRAKVRGQYPTVDGLRPMTAERDCDFRDGSPQLAGKTPDAILQLRATGARKAETGAKLRAVRETFAIDHGVWDFEIDLPFVFARPVFTWTSKDPAVQAIFAQALVQMATSARATLWGPAHTPHAPALVGGEPAPALLGPPAPSSSPRAVVHGGDGGMGFDGDEGDDAAPPPLPPPPPPPPLQAGDPRRIRLPGRDTPTIADASTDQLVRAEERERRGLVEGTWNAQYVDQNARRLLTMRAVLTERGMTAPPCPVLERLVAEGRAAAAA